ncbi:MAG: LamB/YcsF family protein [Opitutaceae bacterium]
MDRLILNCDLGENESAEQTRSLMALVNAANICCGVHAGSIEKTREALLLAKEYGVLVGAHPGLATAGGRGCDLPNLEEFRVIVEKQLNSFLELAKELEVGVAYVKLHGSLYSAVEADEGLLTAYIEILEGLSQNLGVFALAGGSCAAACRQKGIRVWEEAFADRAYYKSGALVPRSERGAVLGLQEAKRRFHHWREQGVLFSIRGEALALTADTLCVHSDSADALELLKFLR